MNGHHAQLGAIRTFRSLVKYLRDEMGWPIGADSFEDLTFDYSAEELGIDAKNAAKIEEIKRLRPLASGQPWGIFFVKFEPKRLPVVALRRILSQVVLKKRATAKAAELAAWAADDLLFVSNYGEGDARHISFAHFSTAEGGADLPTLKVLGWDNLDTPLHLDDVAEHLTRDLAWPEDENDAKAWRKAWRGAFTLGHREVITTSRDLSIRLAELARVIRDRIGTALAIENAMGPLTVLMKAFQSTLMHDLDAAGFADMYAQTIAYGLLSSRIADPKARTADDFAAHMRTNPFVRELMQTFLRVGGRRGKAGGPGIDFDELGVSDVIDLLDGANMEAVVRDFGDRNPDEDPVIHFYELFLTKYDAEKRMQRGVFYTPRPVVSFIVRSMDEQLRTEFGLIDGLADITSWGEIAKLRPGMEIPFGTPPEQSFVQILDPATGTGTFLVETIELIHQTMVAKWKASGHGNDQIDLLWNKYVATHLLPRLHGYELLMAPYAIAHLKLGLKLYETGYRFESEERAQIYLTNALEPAPDLGQQKLAGILPALAHEAQAVNVVKRQKRFTVVLGNPPYAGHSQNNQIDWVVDKVHDYKRGIPELQKPAQAKWLQDDYVKFIRFAEYIVETCGAGVIGFVTNHSFIDNPTFLGMRKHLLEVMSSLALLDLRGSTKKRHTGANNSADENVFEIQQGVSILIAARKKESSNSSVRFAEITGTQEEKYIFLEHYASRGVAWIDVIPRPKFYLFRPQSDRLDAEYGGFMSVADALSGNGDPAPGIVTTHDAFAVSWSRPETMEKVEALLATKNEAKARELFRLCATSQWNYTKAKAELSRGIWKGEMARILYRPFDTRWTVMSQHVAVHRRLRATEHMLLPGNVGICIGKAGQVAGDGEWNLVLCSQYPVDFNLFYRGGACIFPLKLKETGLGLPADVSIISNAFSRRVALAVGTNATRATQAVDAKNIFGYIYAILYSRSYRTRYAEFLKVDYPRIPTPGDGACFKALANLGLALMSLHLLDSQVLSNLSDIYVGPKAPIVERVGWSDHTVWLNAPSLPSNRVFASGSPRFEDVSEEVWQFRMGGYQVCEKWLKDRKGRTLSAKEIVHYQKIVGAITETIRLMGEIDAIIEEHGGWPGAFAATEAEA